MLLERDNYQRTELRALVRHDLVDRRARALGAPVRPSVVRAIEGVPRPHYPRPAADLDLDEPSGSRAVDPLCRSARTGRRSVDSNLRRSAPRSTGCRFITIHSLCRAGGLCGGRLGDPILPMSVITRRIRSRRSRLPSSRGRSRKADRDVLDSLCVSSPCSCPLLPRPRERPRSSANMLLFAPPRRALPTRCPARAGGSSLRSAAPAARGRRRDREAADYPSLRDQRGGLSRVLGADRPLDLRRADSRAALAA